MTQSLAIQCTELRRVYEERGLLGKSKQTVALESVTFQVPKGVVFGLLGPNGAGKTTTVRVLATLLAPSDGTARVLGFDVGSQAQEVRRHIGLILGGDRGLYWRLTALENLIYFGALNGIGPREASRRGRSLLDRVGLGAKADTRVEQYSRGMKQRLHIARGLLTDPEVIFMDEPTIGLDPMAARELRDVIPQLAAEGKTVLLTTHYMFEADTLCDRIAIINHGRLVAEGTPAEIKRTFSGIRVIDLTLREMRDGLVTQMADLAGVVRIDTGSDGPLEKLTIQVAPTSDVRETLLNLLPEQHVESFIEREPTLEEAYLSILK